MSTRSVWMIVLVAGLVASACTTGSAADKDGGGTPSSASTSAAATRAPRSSDVVRSSGPPSSSKPAPELSSPPLGSVGPQVSACRRMKASRACLRALRTLGGHATTSKTQAALNSFARCMQQHGVVVQPDLMAIRFLDLSTRGVRSAFRSCDQLLPANAPHPASR